MASVREVRAADVFLNYDGCTERDVRGVFARYDGDGDGRLRATELKALLRDVGLVTPFDTDEDEAASVNAADEAIKKGMEDNRAKLPTAKTAPRKKNPERPPGPHPMRYKPRHKPPTQSQRKNQLRPKTFRQRPMRRVRNRLTSHRPDSQPGTPLSLSSSPG